MARSAELGLKKWHAEFGVSATCGNFLEIHSQPRRERSIVVAVDDYGIHMCNHCSYLLPNQATIYLEYLRRRLEAEESLGNYQFSVSPSTVIKILRCFGFGEFELLSKLVYGLMQ